MHNLLLPFRRLFQLGLVIILCTFIILQVPFVKRSLLDSLLQSFLPEIHSHIEEIKGVGGILPFSLTIKEITFQPRPKEKVKFANIDLSWNPITWILHTKATILTNYIPHQVGPRIEFDLIHQNNDIVISSLTLTHDHAEMTGSGFYTPSTKQMHGTLQGTLGNEENGKIVFDLDRQSNGALTLHLTGDSLYYDEFRAQSFQGIFTLTADLQGKFEGRLSHPQWGQLSLETLDSTFDFQKETILVQFKGIGTGPTTLDVQGEVDRSVLTSSQNTHSLKVNLFDIKTPWAQAHLKDPFSVLIEPSALKIPTARLILDKGELILDTLSWGDHLTGRIQLDQFPLIWLNTLNPNVAFKGALSLKGELSGSSDHPTIILDILGKSISWGGTSSFSGKIEGLDLSTKIHLQDSTLTWKTALSAGIKTKFQLTSEGKIQDIKRSDSPMEGKILGNGNIQTFSTLIPSGDKLKGNLVLSAQINGHINQPNLTGKLSLQQGYYENTLYGTILKNAALEAIFSKNELKIQTFLAKDLTKGTLTARGGVLFPSLLSPEVDITLDLKKFMIAQMDFFSGRADGFLSLKGAGENMHVEGKATLTHSKVQLEETTPNIPTISLVEHDGQPVIQEKNDDQDDSTTDSTILPLNISVHVPNNMFLLGFGINSRWKGDLLITGPITKPKLKGTLIIIKGKIDLFGKPMRAKSGTIIYTDSGKRNDPELAFLMVRDVAGVEAQLHIEGRGSNPKISFTSAPPLPQEEILSHLLFGRSLSSVSASQGLQLANTLNILNGEKGLNFVDKIRTAFGLDVLEIKETEITSSSSDSVDNTVKGHALSFGKQISDKVYLSIDQGVSGDTRTNATVQVDITPKLKVEGSVGGDKNSSIGFSWITKY